MDNECDNPGLCWEANAETRTRQSRAGYDVYRDARIAPLFLRLRPVKAGEKG